MPSGRYAPSSGHGEINAKTGAVMTQAEQVHARKLKGLCILCGDVQTHTKKFKLTGPKMIPLDVEGKVINGKCLACFAETNSSKSKSSGRGNMPIRQNNMPTRQSNMLTRQSNMPTRQSNMPRRGVPRTTGSTPFSDSNSLNSGPSRSSEDKFSNRRGSGESVASSRSNGSGRGSGNHGSDRISEESPTFSENAPPHTVSLNSTGVSQLWLANIKKNDDFTAILEFMRKFPDEASIIKSFDEMGTLSASPEHRNKTCKEMQKLIKSMGIAEFHRGNSQMLTQACRTLTQFSDSDSSDKKKRIGVFGGVTYILSFMKALPNEPSVQRWACNALANLATEESNQSLMIRSNVLELIVNVIEGPSMDDDAIEWANNVLVALIPSINTRGREGPKIVAAIANGILRHKHSRNACFYGVSTLGKMLECLGGIHEFRPTIRAISSCITLYHLDIPLQIEGFTFLVNLASLENAPMGKLVVPPGLMDHIGLILALCDESAPNHREKLLDLHTEVAVFFQIILKDRSVMPRDMIAYQQCVEHIATLMYTNLYSAEPEKSSIFLSVCLRITNLVYSTRQTTEPNFTLIGLIMEIHPDSVDLQTQAFMALHSIVITEEHAACVADANIILSIKSVMEQHINNYELVLAALQAVHKLGGFNSTMLRFSESKIWEPIGVVLGRAKDPQMARDALAGLIGSLIGSKEFMKDNMGADVLDSVIKALNTFSRDTEVQEQGCVFLKGSLNETNVELLRGNEGLSEVLFRACDVSDECMKLANTVIQIVYEW